MTPTERFRDLMSRAHSAGIPEPTAMALATVGSDGRPSLRMVLLKGFDERGFVYYTNLDSRKARETADNPWAALCFHWQPLEAQVRIEGKVSQVDGDEADAYFVTRPRGSQIGAWASLQSRPLASARELEGRISEAELRFAGGDIPRPPFWTGFRLVPDRIEFWSGRPDRLHVRECFERTPDGEWTSHRLYP